MINTEETHFSQVLVLEVFKFGFMTESRGGKGWNIIETAFIA